MGSARIDLEDNEYIEIESDPDLDYWHMTVVDACPHESRVTLWTVNHRLDIIRALAEGTGLVLVDGAEVLGVASAYGLLKYNAARDPGRASLDRADEKYDELRALLGLGEQGA
jgi:hypothetical protein